jgi:hypothetical protein
MVRGFLKMEYIVKLNKVLFIGPGGYAIGAKNHAEKYDSEASAAKALSIIRKRLKNDFETAEIIDCCWYE